MGVWGNDFYQNDIASDIKDMYLLLKSQGNNEIKIIDKIFSEFSDYMHDEEDSDIVILALADLQCKYGRLDSSIKKMAMRIIGNEAKSAFLQCNKQLKPKREKFLKNLLTELENFNLSSKKNNVKQAENIVWSCGDVFAYELTDVSSNDYNLEGNFAIIITVDECNFDSGEIAPIVWVKLTRKKEIPKNLKEINKLDFIQIYFKFKDEKLHYMNINKNIKENETLPIYRICLLKNTKRTIPNKLVYLGNYCDVTPPKNEFVPQDELDLPCVLWRDFQKKIIERYNLYSKKRQ